MKPTNDNGAHSFTEGATFETAENINEFLKEEKTMKPQFKHEEIYLDLSKLSEEERLLTPKIIDSQDIFLKDFINDGNFIDYYDLHFGKYGWTISKNLEDSEKQEITYSQFLDMMGEIKEVLQVENNGWIKILSETDLPKEVDQYWFASHNNKIEIRFYNPNWINDRVQFRHRYTHYQPIVKPLPPKF